MENASIMEVHEAHDDAREQQSSGGGRKRQAPPVDLAIRKRAIELVLDEKWTQTDAARALGVNRATLSQIIKRFKKDPSSLGGSSRTPFALSSEHRARIRAWVDDDCGLMLQALQNKARAAFGFPVSVAALNLALRSLHFSVTRLSAPLPLPPDQLNSNEALQMRYEYGLEYVRLFPKRHKLVFVGEAEFVFSVRTRPNATKTVAMPATGESDEALSAQFSVRAHQFSVTAAVMDSRVLLHRVRFGEHPDLSFETLVTRVADALHNAEIEDAVIVLGAEYRAKSVQSPGIAASLGHSLLFLPPDSPSLMNPVESFYGEWNTTVRRGAPPASEQELLHAIESCGATLTAEECAAYFRRAEMFIYPSILNERIVE